MTQAGGHGDVALVLAVRCSERTFFTMLRSGQPSTDAVVEAGTRDDLGALLQSAAVYYQLIG
jgi:hypothetical protein